jgi:hypothetical protein
MRHQPQFFTFLNGITVLRQACFLALVAAGRCWYPAPVDAPWGRDRPAAWWPPWLKQLGTAAGLPRSRRGRIGLFNGWVVGKFKIDSRGDPGDPGISGGLALIISKGLTITTRRRPTRAWPHQPGAPALPVLINAAVLVVMYFVLAACASLPRLRGRRQPQGRLAGVNAAGDAGVFGGAGI